MRKTLAFTASLLSSVGAPSALALSGGLFLHTHTVFSHLRSGEQGPGWARAAALLCSQPLPGPWFPPEEAAGRAALCAGKAGPPQALLHSE